MKASDNATAHQASEYDRQIRKSIPCYDQIHQETINIVSCYANSPKTWIDVGCGTGTLVERAYEAFPTTRFILADPSAAMLELAARKLEGRDRVTILKAVAAEEVALAEPADAVSAVLSLHYSQADRRRQAIRNCFRLLRDGGIFVTFENIRPLTKKGTEVAIASWERYELRAGRRPEEARRHVERFGVEFFPITIEEHLRLLREVRFSVVELLWYSYVQAGFYCIK